MTKQKRKILSGFTILELLIALAVTAMLMATIAVAFNATAVSYRENENISKTVNLARQSLLRITSQLRTGVVDPNVMETDKCTVLCSDGSLVTFYHSTDDNKLYLRNEDTVTDYVLCNNVTAMTFVKDDTTETGDIKSVQVSITVQSGGQTRTISTAAAIRRVLQ